MVLFVQVAAADTVTLIPSADATLFEVNPDNSAGGAIFFNAGTTQNHTRDRALLQFDLSSLPSGAQITGVGLELDVVRRPADGFEASVFGLHRMLRSWGEGTTVPTDNRGGLGAPAMLNDATWNDRFAFSQHWGQPGGAPDIDYVSQFSSSTIIYDRGRYQFEGTLDMVHDVQSWLDHPETNFGWMLITESEDTPFTARRFASREDPGSAPRLTIDFEVVPEPGTLALWGLGFIGLACFRRRKSRN